MNRKLRVASVVASIRSGGIGPVCKYAARALAKETGWDIKLLSLYESTAELESTDGTYHARGLDLRSDCARSFLAWLQRNPQDVLITSGVSELEPAFPYLPREVNHIVQIHDSGKRYRGVATRYARYVDGVVCVAKHIEDRLVEELAGCSFSGLLGTVYNGASFPAIPDRSSAGCGNVLNLLFMGRLDPLKGISDIVPILRGARRKKLPVMLHVVGQPDPHLCRSVERAGLSGLVTWHGRVPHEQCYSLAAQADVFLMLSRKEPFGMVLIEAMSMGCVPIAYDVPSGPAEIIVHGESGLLAPLGHTSVVVDLLTKLHADPEKWRRMSEAAVARARSDFNADRMASGMADFIKRVVDQGAQRPIYRLEGEPPWTPRTLTAKPRGYRRLPQSWRLALRRYMGSHAALCYRMLNR